MVYKSTKIKHAFLWGKEFICTSEVLGLLPTPSHSAISNIVYKIELEFNKRFKFF